MCHWPNAHSFSSDINCISLPASVCLCFPWPCPQRPPQPPPPPSPSHLSAGGWRRGRKKQKTKLKGKKKKSKVSFFLFGFVCLPHVGRFVGVTHLQGNQLCLVEWRPNSMHTDSRCQSQKYVRKKAISQLSVLANTKCFCQTLLTGILIVRVVDVEELFHHSTFTHRQPSEPFLSVIIFFSMVLCKIHLVLFLLHFS